MTQFEDIKQSIITILGIQIHFNDEIVAARLYGVLPFKWDKVCSFLAKHLDQKTQEHVEKGYMFFKEERVAITVHALEEEPLTILLVFKPNNEEIARIIIPSLKFNFEILANLFTQKYRDCDKKGFLSHQEFKSEIDRLFKSKGVERFYN
ncbi:hypothetical protein LCGC14_0964080 [marine sediment metagenome]|uniref:Uncharacterized protein n=1 Tax=marine sediment metagenome TaxID=412755 RepID=A0A0F9NZP2_9ZZZZ